MRVIRLACLFVLGTFVGAVSADQKTSPRVEKAAQLNATLASFQGMKVREKTLQMLIRRSKGSRQADYSREYEQLRPKLYDAAQKMEKEVQDFERLYGRKVLCQELKAEVHSVVGICSAPSGQP